MDDTPYISVVIIPRGTASDHRACAEKLYTRFDGRAEVLYSDVKKNEDIKEGTYTTREEKRIIYVPRSEEDSDDTILRKCISAACGAYIYFIDDRDSPEDSFINGLEEKCAPADIDIVIFDLIEIDPDNGTKKTIKGIVNGKKIKDSSGFDRKDTGNSIFVLTEPILRNKLFKRSFLESFRSKLPMTDINGISMYSVICMGAAGKIAYAGKSYISYKPENDAAIKFLPNLYDDTVTFLTEARKFAFFDSVSASAFAFAAEILLKQLIYAGKYYSPCDYAEYLYKITSLFNTEGFDPGNIITGTYSALYRDIKNTVYRNYFSPEDSLDNKSKDELNKLRSKGYLPQSGFIDESKYIVSAISLLRELEALETSQSYMIGRAMTWLPRKIRGFSRCLKDHGVVYTLKRIAVFFGIRIDKPKKKKIKTERKKIEYAVNRLKRKQRITISLTSFPARIETVDKTLYTLMDQSVKPDRIVLWLAREQFQRGNRDIPKHLLRLRRYGLSIKWCDDIKSHKKYYYSMKKYPKDLIITADDDLYYGRDTVKLLYESYIKYPHAISALRAHLITFNDNDSINPYQQWMKEYSEIREPSMRLLATSGGGTLFPPGTMHSELFNKEMILKTCINADDLWLKIMQVMNGTPVVIAGNAAKLSYVEGSQTVSLWHDNIGAGGNDRQLKAILDEYNEYYGKEDTLIERIRKDK